MQQGAGKGESNQTRFCLLGWTTEQLRHCFPDVRAFAEKKQRAAGMNEDVLVEMLHQVQSSPTRVWISSEVGRYLQARQMVFEDELQRSAWGFRDCLLALVSPELCWVCLGDGRAGLLVDREYFRQHLAELKRSLLEEALLVSSTKTKVIWITP